MSTPGSTIRRRDKANRDAGFERLRAAGIELLQKTSGETWTDHNLHDPGITMLEQLCYSLTELVYRTEFPVEDLLCGSDGEIDFAALSLHPPQEVFPCRATTAADYRRLLLDRVEDLDDARVQRVPGPPRGILALWLKPAAIDAESTAQRARQALDACRAERGLGEDIAPAPVLVQAVPCELQADIDIAGPHDPAEVLAEIYHRAAFYVDHVAHLLTRAELRAAGMALEDIYDGPAVGLGFAADEGEAGATLDDRLYVADLVQHLKQHVPGILDVHCLALQVRGEAAADESLPWRGDDWALRLQVPGQPGVQPLVQVRLMRRRQPLPVDEDDLRRRVQVLQAADRARRLRPKESLAGEEAADLPRGSYRPPGAYRSVQYDFPAVYGIGRHGVPASAGAQRVARARQLRAYLVLFEQLIANGGAQLAHLPALFSGAVGRYRTYWWQLLGRDNLPEPEHLFLYAPEDIERLVMQPLDRAATRRHHLLDHLLALHGHDLQQHAVRQYGGHLTPDEVDTLLLDLKAAWLRDVVPLSRHRARGFDYGRPLWSRDHRDNFSGLARRVCLLLGFRDDHARSLTRLLRDNRIELAPGAVAGAEVDPLSADAGDAVLMDSATGQDHLAALGLRRGNALPLALLSAAVAHDGYRLLSSDGPGDARDGPTTLALRDADGLRWWRLHSFATRTQAEQAACQLRAATLRLNDACEGLHLVEHLLLRPLQHRSQAHEDLELPGDFFELRVTAVLPNWTVRTRQAGFQRLAEETLLSECPIHLRLCVAWLDFPKLCRFEAAFQDWLDKRRGHCAQPRLPGDLSFVDAAQVDAAAAEVIRQLRGQGKEPASPGHGPEAQHG